jgi:hypothetical protein
MSRGLAATQGLCLLRRPLRFERAPWRRVLGRWLMRLHLPRLLASHVELTLLGRLLLALLRLLLLLALHFGLALLLLLLALHLELALLRLLLRLLLLLTLHLELALLGLLLLLHLEHALLLSLLRLHLRLLLCAHRSGVVLAVPIIGRTLCQRAWGQSHEAGEQSGPYHRLCECSFSGHIRPIWPSDSA